LIKAAFDEHPTPSSVFAMTRLNSLPTIRPKIAADLQSYLDDFVQRQVDYQKQDGYFLRLVSAEISARFLSRFHPEEKKKFAELATTLRNDSKSINQIHIW